MRTPDARIAFGIPQVYSVRGEARADRGKHSQSNPKTKKRWGSGAKSTDEQRAVEEKCEGRRGGSKSIERAAASRKQGIGAKGGKEKFMAEKARKGIRARSFRYQKNGK